MIVQCLQCSKRFKLDPDLIKGLTARVRCSNCQLIFTVARPQPSAAEDLTIATDEVEISRPVSRPSVKRILLLVIPVIFILAGVALWSYMLKPMRSESIPKGSGIELLHLIETRGYFVDNQTAGQLFVIEGRLRNEFSSPRRWIHLRAKLYTTDGKAAQQLDFYAGHPLTAHELRSMALKDLLARVKRRPDGNERALTVAAQDEISFTVPFGNLPELTKLSDYSVEILASQPT